MNLKTLFLNHIAQTSDNPMLGFDIDIVRAEGSWLYDLKNNAYLDLISGISVSALGHAHPEISKAIYLQSQRYSHLMVFGEFIQRPQVDYMMQLKKHLAPTLNSIYYCNSGSEAIEGALKLAKRVTGRTKCLSFKKAYHGSTHGALSLCSESSFKQHALPLLPETDYLTFNSLDELHRIDQSVAAVVFEYVQAESGVHMADFNFITQLAAQCKRSGTLMIADEIQSGFGRCGTFFAQELYHHVPDVLVLAKAMGGGLPMGAFIASKEHMHALSYNPMLGHLTTFGGNAICLAAASAALDVMEREQLFYRGKELQEVIKKHLNSDRIHSLRCIGAWAAVEFSCHELCFSVIRKALEAGIITDWFLFNPKALRISPPLNIPINELIQGLQQLNSIINQTAGPKSASIKAAASNS